MESMRRGACCRDAVTLRALTPGAVMPGARCTWPALAQVSRRHLVAAKRHCTLIITVICMGCVQACIKLRAQVPCKEMFYETYDAYLSGLTHEEAA